MSRELLAVDVLSLRVSVRVYKAFGLGVTFDGPSWLVGLKLLVGPFGISLTSRNGVRY